MSKRDFNIDELQRAIELLGTLNLHALRDLSFSSPRRAVPQPTEEQIAEWEDTGLNNVDFVRHFLDTGEWPTWITARED